jgi:hypothetical protein
VRKPARRPQPLHKPESLTTGRVFQVEVANRLMGRPAVCVLDDLRDLGEVLAGLECNDGLAVALTGLGDGSLTKGWNPKVG